MADLSFEEAVGVIHDLGDKIADMARLEAPVKTGRLQGSIHSDSLPDGARVSADAPYAGFVNSGTRRMSARPFFTNAVLDAQNEIVQRITARLRQ